jgi:hypothetical protein
VSRAPIEIVLHEPVILRSAATGAEVERIEKLTFREPRAGDMAAAMDAGGKDSPGQMILALAARCTGLTRAQVEALCLEDFVQISEAAQAFLERGPQTGKTASASSAGPSALPAGRAGQPTSSAS